MEGITWLTHRYVMHGFLWYLHKDHHEKGEGFFEKNDAFFLIFAIPSWLCIMLGSMNQNYISVSIGAGIAMYGFAYFLVHEIIIHQRFKLFRNVRKAVALWLSIRSSGRRIFLLIFFCFLKQFGEKSVLYIDKKFINSNSFY
jgi:hypothetical protein